MKTTITVQALGHEWEDKALVQRIKDAWTEQGHKIKEIETLQIYLKVEEAKCYYVINGTEKGCLSI